MGFSDKKAKRCGVDSLIIQFIYLAIIIVLGGGVLYLRRKASGNKSFYKFVLIILGLLLAAYTVNGTSIIHFDRYFLGSVGVLLLVILMFELSVRLNPENIRITRKHLTRIGLLVIANLVIITLLATVLLGIDLVQAMVYALIISTIEFFIIEELRAEGDLANPLLLLFSFLVFGFYVSMQSTFFSLLYFLQYLLIGLGMGVLVGILVFKSLKHRRITWFHELALIAAALTLFICTEYVNGSGLFAVMVMGMFYGNSFVRKRADYKSFSPFIFKSLEMLIFILIGFAIPLLLSWKTFWQSLLIFVVYLALRFVVITLVHKSYSLKNKFYLTIAPKGMILGIMIILLSTYLQGSTALVNSLLMILLLSLIVSTIAEHLEHKKIMRLDRLFEVLKKIRFGRKQDLKQKR